MTRGVYPMRSTGTFQERMLSGLAALENEVKNLRDLRNEDKQAADDDRVVAHESRAELHTKVNAAVSRIDKLSNDVAISGQVNAMARDEIADLKKVVEKNALAVAPTVEQVQAVQNIGKIALWVIGVFGVGIITAGVAIGGAVRQAIVAALWH